MQPQNSGERWSSGMQSGNRFSNSLGPNGIHLLLWIAAYSDLEDSIWADADSVAAGHRAIGGSSQQAQRPRNLAPSGSYITQYASTPDGYSPSNPESWARNPTQNREETQYQANLNASTIGSGNVGRRLDYHSVAHDPMTGGASRGREHQPYYSQPLPSYPNQNPQYSYLQSPEQLQPFNGGASRSGGQTYMPTPVNSHPGYPLQQAQGGSSVGDDETNDDNLTQNLIRPQIYQNSDIAERLDPAFQVAKNHRTFFIEGRVFKMLWIEPVGSNAPDGTANVFVDRYGGEFFAKVQRFIVVKPKPKKYYSNCVQISTNGGKGAAKKGLVQQEHTIAYTALNPPPRLPEETKLNKKPIKVIPINQTEKLDETSRINLAKVYPVEHNVKVCLVGMVQESDMKTLRQYYKSEMQKDLL